MANTYSQLSIQVVFAVKRRENIIVQPWRDDLHKYISGIIKAEGAKPLAAGGWMDHVHIFFGLPVTARICDLVGKVKANSSRWINDNRLVAGRFEWQSGYAAFSYAKSQRDSVIRYIMEQERHHGGESFKEEYLNLLKEFDIAYDEKYLFEFF
ncbi:MAG: IS200/IS605 family transposase [Chitinophagaceae bacterium]|nr:IS200/IS605 family transposase [Chitinophagaceae bacterium]